VVDEVAISGDSSTPTAISSEPPPISITNSRPLDQPNHRLAAKKVNFASSSPDKTCKSILKSLLIELIISSPLIASRRADVANGRSS
jgi:hypothetical protein